MSFLVPLYIAGALTVALPILAHLLKRRPRGQRPFGSLMFLSASPPRFTRRSRLEDLLLLALRALALVLIAFAFARPFVRDAAALEEVETGGRIAILVDVSASMQRGQTWTRALARAREVIDEAAPTDRLALYSFARELRSALAFEELERLEPRQRLPLLRERLGDLAPTWESTELANALATLADQLESGPRDEGERPPAASRIVLISDLQRGSSVEVLRAYPWPESVTLEILRPDGEGGANASIHPLREVQANTSDDTAASEGPRVLVRNADESDEIEIELRWVSPTGEVGEPEAHVIPPASSRVVRAPARPPEAVELILEGDAFDFDNRLFLPLLDQASWDVVYIGRDEAGSGQGLLYYLERVLSEEGRPSVRLLSRAPEEGLPDVDLARTPLVILGDPLPSSSWDALRSWLDDGGQALVVAREPVEEGGEAPHRRMLEALGLELAFGSERSDDGYAMLGEIDFAHPLFAPFADPRFGDFTQIHFWRHRRIERSGESSVIARFDDGAPFLLENVTGAGRLFVMSCGWQPSDSQLALSSKFPALILGLLRLSPRLAELEPSYTVGDGVELPPAEADAAATVIGPDGTEYELAEGSLSFSETDRPGIYRARVGSREHQLAVNLDPAESDIEPLDVSELEQAGAVLGSAERRSQQRQHSRRLHDVALEREQKLWQWLVAGAVVVLIFETGLAGRRRRHESIEVTT